MKIGLTGGIGSGKSTVAAVLVELGAVLVDTDAIARALTAPGGAALPALAREFGPAMITAEGALDRDRMRALAFGSAEAKARLEGVLHPMITAQALREAAAAAGRSVVFDVPLLAESAHWRARVDLVLVVDCDAPTQIERVMRRNGWAEDAVQRVIAQQATRAARLAIADAVVFNGAGSSLAELRTAVQAVWQRWHADGG